MKKNITVVMTILLLVIFAMSIGLHIFSLRFRTFVYPLIGIYICIYIAVLLSYKLKNFYIKGINYTIICLFIICFLSVSILCTKFEYTVDKDGQKCVAMVVAWNITRVDYYRCINFLIQEQEAFLHEDYGKGAIDPFTNENYEYIYKCTVGNTIYYEVIEKK